MFVNKMSTVRTSAVVIAQTSAAARGIVLCVVSLVCRHKLDVYYENSDAYIAMTNENVILFVISCFDVIAALIIGCILAASIKDTCTSTAVFMCLPVLLFSTGEMVLLVLVYRQLWIHTNEDDVYVDTPTVYMCGLVIAAVLTSLQLACYVCLRACSYTNLHVGTDDGSKHLWNTDKGSNMIKDVEHNKTKTPWQWWFWNSYSARSKSNVSHV